MPDSRLRLTDQSDALRSAISSYARARLHSDVLGQRHSMLPNSATMDLPVLLDIDKASETELCAADILDAALDRMATGNEVEAVIDAARELRAEPHGVDLQADILQRAAVVWARRMQI